MRHPDEVPVSVPRPSLVRPGEPAPWEGRRFGPLDLSTVSERLARLGRVTRGEAPSDPSLRESAVLVPLLDGDEVRVVLGKRSASLPSHRGDLSFPGGRRHPEDADLLETALRETHEEFGIPPDRVRVIGALDRLGTVTTRFSIAPFVGVVSGSPSEFVAQEGEVDRILVIPIRRLLEPGVFRQEIWSGRAPSSLERGPDDPSVLRAGDGVTYGVVMERPVNFFEIDEWDVVWGATATILRQFLDVITMPG